MSSAVGEERGTERLAAWPPPSRGAWSPGQRSRSVRREVVRWFGVGGAVESEAPRLQRS